MHMIMHQVQPARPPVQRLKRDQHKEEEEEKQAVQLRLKIGQRTPLETQQGVNSKKGVELRTWPQRKKEISKVVSRVRPENPPVQLPGSA